ncbi:MAG: exonuclease domain-containing protein [Clostridia bacterium]|nr:exonuclease domain-containing protein [Clostridia bacterium]
MNYIFVDFEMERIDRIHKTARKISRMEIIEIGAVMLNSDFEEISSFKRYVKPSYSEHISNMITDLTGISDATLLGKKDIREELLNFSEWCLSEGEEFCVYAWSENDLAQVISEMKLKNITKTPSLTKVIDNWKDLQLEFDKSLLKDYHTSLSNALDALGMVFEGHMHDALDDAHNTGRVYKAMATSDDYKEEVNIIKSYLYDENRKSGATLGDLLDFSIFNFDFS